MFKAGFVQQRGKKNPNWRGGKRIVNVCGKCGLKKRDYVKRRYCSRICSLTSPQRRELQRKNAIGNKAHWKGENIGYQQLHVWIRKQLGKPKRCEHCGRSKIRLEWANKSRKYKRTLTDWIALCSKCHSAYDRK